MCKHFLYTCKYIYVCMFNTYMYYHYVLEIYLLCFLIFLKLFYEHTMYMNIMKYLRIILMFWYVRVNCWMFSNYVLDIMMLCIHNTLMHLSFIQHNKGLIWTARKITHFSDFNDFHFLYTALSLHIFKKGHKMGMFQKVVTKKIKEIL